MIGSAVHEEVVLVASNCGWFNQLEIHAGLCAPEVNAVRSGVPQVFQDMADAVIVDVGGAGTVL